MIPFRTLLFFFIFVLAIASLEGAVLHAQELSGRVSWVYDGDTIKVEGFGKVRLLGIDTPEWEDSPRDKYYLRRGVRRELLRTVADQARERVIGLVKGRVVTLEIDGDGKDRHGRLLAYVRLADGQLLNRLLVEEGLASVYRKFSFSRKKEFLVLEEKARRCELGLWSN